MTSCSHLDQIRPVTPGANGCEDCLKTSSSPDQLVLDFFRSTYELGATLGGWDRVALERPDPLRHH